MGKLEAHFFCVMTNDDERTINLAIQPMEAGSSFLLRDDDERTINLAAQQPQS
jgi:hypothetical protein